MRLRWIPVWITAVIGVVLAEAWLRPLLTPRGDVAAIERFLHSELRDAEAKRRIGSAALVLVHDGRVVAAHGFGVAPVSVDRTRFLLASVSKAVTAWGVMRLVQDGRIGLDEPVMRHLKRWRFPGSERFRDRVTVRHLLSHTAGLDDGLGYGGFGPGERIQTIEESLTLTRDSTVGAPRRVTVAREPGTAMAYSGGGYTILQLLVEEVTGQPFAAYISGMVLEPLGMKTATFEDTPPDVAPSFDRDLEIHPPRRYAAKAAVALYASPHDVGRFLIAFTRPNPVLRAETVRQMLTPQPATGGAWGLGHTIFAVQPTRIVGHDGGTGPGWGAAIRVNPASGNGVAILVSGARIPISRLADAWVYSETGLVTVQSRRQIVYDRAVPAAIAIATGVIVILTTRWRRERR